MSKLSVKSEAANGGGEMGDVPLENWGDVPIPGKLEGGGLPPSGQIRSASSLILIFKNRFNLTRFCLRH